MPQSIDSQPKAALYIQEDPNQPWLGPAWKLSVADRAGESEILPTVVCQAILAVVAHLPRILRLEPAGPPLQPRPLAHVHPRRLCVHLGCMPLQVVAVLVHCARGGVAWAGGEQDGGDARGHLCCSRAQSTGRQSQRPHSAEHTLLVSLQPLERQLAPHALLRPDPGALPHPQLLAVPDCVYNVTQTLAARVVPASMRRASIRFNTRAVWERTSAMLTESKVCDSIF